jgi:hypothetical protein
MNRARFVFAAALLGAGLAGPVLAQTPQAPQLTPVLAGRNIKPPFKGNAAVEFAKPDRSREKDMVIEKIKVKNLTSAPIARLTIDETWYDKAGATIGGGKGVLNGLLQPGEIQTITVESPYNAKMSANQYRFSHANGGVTPKQVNKFDAEGNADVPKAPAAKPAAKKK